MNFIDEYPKFELLQNSSNTLHSFSNYVLLDYNRMNEFLLEMTLIQSKVIVSWFIDYRKWLNLKCLIHDDFPNVNFLMILLQNSKNFNARMGKENMWRQFYASYCNFWQSLSVNGIEFGEFYHDSLNFIKTLLNMSTELFRCQN